MSGEMRSALYFPHTDVRSKGLIHNALLMWDELEFIVPFLEYRPAYTDATCAEAMEIIGVPRVASEDEKREVHALISDLLAGGVPEAFLYSPSTGKQDYTYEMWPQKLLPETFDLLRAIGLTDGHLSNMDYPMSQAAGLTIMAVLADTLAGQSRVRITDRGLAYAAIANAPKVATDAHETMRIVPLTFKGISTDRIPLGRLIEFRKHEAAAHGHDYRKLRHNYLEAIQKHLQRISTVPPHSRDRREFDRAFQSDMEDDLRDLKSELGFARRDAWLSKDVLTFALSGSGLLGAAAGIPDLPLPGVITGAGAIALIGGMLGTGNKLAKARTEILRKHPMAYLYEVAG